jgi:hypothetical protein
MWRAVKEYDLGFVGSKERRAAERKRALNQITILLIIVLAPLSVWMLHRDRGWDKFDKNQWEVGGSALLENETGCRKRMVQDLMERYLKPGMTRRRVRELLGPPDFVESSPLYEYQVARNTGFRIAFDRDGYYTSAAVVRY